MFASPLDQCIDHTFLVPRHTMDFGMRHLTDRKEQGHPADVMAMSWGFHGDFMADTGGKFPPVVGGGSILVARVSRHGREVSGRVQQGVNAATSLWGGSRGAMDMVHAVSTHRKRIDQRWAWFHGMMNFPKHPIRGSYSYHTYVNTICYIYIYIVLSDVIRLKVN